MDNMKYKMKYKILIVAILILLGNQKTFSQNSSTKGKCIEYKTGNVIPGVTMSFHTPSGIEYGNGEWWSDINGIFELKMGDDSGDLIIRFLGCYTIKILNIPQGLKHIDFGEIKMVENYGRAQFYMDGTPAELSEDQIEQDKKMRKDVLRKYRIKILGKKLKPYFEENYLVFDFDKNK